MPKGTIDVVRRGEKTRFTGENAAEMGRKGNEARRRNLPIRKCLKNIATEALYGHPPLPDEQLRQVAKFFDIKVKDVTFGHLAIFKQAIEMAKGDPSALNLVAAYAGEKPTENVSVSVGSYDALNEAFSDLNNGGE